jgi:hypothetical protein
MFQTVVNFFVQYQTIIIEGGIFVLYLIMVGKSKTRDILNALIIQAKRLAKDTILSSGQEQENWVVTQAMKYLPVYITVFLGEEKIRKIVRLLYNKARDYADDGIINGSK